MKYNPNLDREGNRVLYLVNEMLQDISSFVPLDSKLVIVYNDKKEIEDYDYPDLDGNDLHFAIYDGEVGEETTLKKAFFYFLSFLNPNLAHDSIVLLGIRLANGFTQVEMAKQLGISKQAYSKMENSESKVSKNVREKACLIKNNLLDNLNFELSDFGI